MPQRFLGLLAGFIWSLILIAPAAADDEMPSDSAAWHRISLEDETLELYAPSSGALLARTTEGLQRSDDGGASWQVVQLPVTSALIRVDHANHDRIVIVANSEVHVSTDGGSTWNRTADLPDRALDLTLSAADSLLAYAATAPRWPTEGDFRVLRSQDGLQSWEPISEQRQPSRCGWSVFLLSAHPLDAGRLFLSAECVFGGITSSKLQQSMDRGSTWGEVFARNAEYPGQIASGGASAPGRLWLSTVKDARSAGSALHRSDDDGQSWSVALEESSLIMPDGSIAPAEVRGLTINPLNADHACIALTPAARTSGQVAAESSSSEVRCTRDAGASWSSLGLMAGGVVHDLAIGIDGANLYSATTSGVWVRAP